MDTLKKSQIVAPTVESTRSPFTGNSQGNEMAYFVENFLNGRVNTALPCKVQAVYSDGISPTGRVDVLPLIVSLDAKNNAINPAPLYNLPYCRIQGGAAALVCDPVPGDIGLAVFCQRDVSNVVTGTAEPVQPGGSSLSGATVIISYNGETVTKRTDNKGLVVFYEVPTNTDIPYIVIASGYADCPYSGHQPFLRVDKESGFTYVVADRERCYKYHPLVPDVVPKRSACRQGDLAKV